MHLLIRVSFLMCFITPHLFGQFSTDPSAGMYFAVLTDGKAIRVQKMLLLK